MPARDDTFRWLALLFAGLALLGFLSYARGVEHQHGQQVGAAGEGAAVVAAGPATAGGRA